MGRGARRRALRAWFGLWNELATRAAGWSEEERSPAVPALCEAARARGVDLTELVRRVRRAFAETDETSLLRTAAKDEEFLDHFATQCDLVEAVWEEIENGGPEGLSARAYFAVDGTEIDDPEPVTM